MTGTALLPKNTVIAEFRPHIYRDPDHFDSLTYLEADCSVTEIQEPDSHIVLLRDNATGKIAGVRIEHYSSIQQL